ncbi:SCO family protein [Diaphorobacter sp. HDW4A]|uniref:SCO family protein n=1 Tax=Diaphorobacter sp. HDW4A TaxID=2714924 RepID=UPI00140B8386|nr:SCO family protein [Diaphorobacter sp. HDW4A]QIL83539.1 SCO family protein [Diaphorobacter sp. HDW4A]
MKPLPQRRNVLAGMAAGAALSCAAWPGSLWARPSSPPVWNAQAPRVPDVTLLDHQGTSVPLRPLLAQGPVAVNFFYTGCSSFCPPQTAIFRQLQALLDKDLAPNTTLISLSIDPLGDSPQAVSRFADRYEARLGANARWWMLTGTAQRTRDIEEVLRAFDVHATSLAEHPAQTWVGYAGKSRWLRSLGLASADELLQWLRAAAA